MLPGAQALLGFQLSVILMRSFEQLPDHAKLLHMVALCCVGLAVILLDTFWPRSIASHLPARTPRSFSRLGSAFVIAAPAALALGIAGDLFVAAYKSSDWSRSPQRFRRFRCFYSRCSGSPCRSLFAGNDRNEGALHRYRRRAQLPKYAQPAQIALRGRSQFSWRGSREFAEATRAKVVLSSTWRYDPAGLFSARHWGLPFDDIVPDMPGRPRRDRFFPGLRLIRTSPATLSSMTTMTDWTRCRCFNPPPVRA